MEQPSIKPNDHFRLVDTNRWKHTAELALSDHCGYHVLLSEPQTWIRSLDSGACLIQATGENADRLILKLGVTKSQRFWMEQLSRKSLNVVVPVVASGYELAGMASPWLLMREVGQALDPERNLKELWLAASTFQVNAGNIPAQEVGTLQIEEVHSWLRDAELHGAPSNHVLALRERLEEDLSFLTGFCDYEVCHGDLQPGNARIVHSGVSQAILLDCEPFVQPWALEIVTPSIIGYRENAVEALLTANQHRGAVGVSQCRVESIRRIAAIASAWIAAKLWGILMQRSGYTRQQKLHGESFLRQRLIASTTLRPIGGGQFPTEIAEKRFCHKPFTFFETDAEGTARVCCADWLPKSIGNLDSGSLESVWNSEAAKLIRHSILNGQFTYCDKTTCPSLVQKTLPKLSEIRKHPFFRRIIDANVTTMSSRPAVLNLGHDNSCNLKCPTCRPELIYLKGVNRKRAENVQSMIESEFLIDAHRLIITGHGDAIASSVYRPFLMRFQARHIPTVKIILMTNGLLFKPAVWDSFHGAHQAIEGVTVSVDGATQETYMLNRGGHFPTLMDNLRFISDLVKQGKLWAEISFVVQANNYKEMPAFVELGKSLSMSVLFQRLVHWPSAFDADQFAERAVHDPGHKDHRDFLRVLQHRLLCDPCVDLSNLEHLLQIPRIKRSR